MKLRRIATALLTAALFGGVAALVPAGVASASTTPAWVVGGSASSSAMSSASSIEISPNGKYLAVDDNGEPAEVSVYSIGDTGALTPAPGSPFTLSGMASSPPGAPLAWSPNSDYLAVPGTNLSSGDMLIEVLSVGTGGALSEASSEDFTDGISTATLTNIEYSPNGEYLAASGNGGVWMFTVGSGGTLTETSGSPIAPSNGGGTLAFSSAGNYLLVTSTSLPEIDIYSVGTGGTLTVTSSSGVTDVSNSGVASVSVSASGDQVALVALPNETSGPYIDTLQTGSLSGGSLFFNNMTSVSADTSTVEAVAESSAGNEEAVAGAGIYSSGPSLLSSPSAVTGAMAVSFGPGDMLAALAGSGNTVDLLVPSTTATATVQPTNPASGQQVTLTASVTDTVPGGEVPAGTATFSSGSTTLCSATVTTAGSGSCTTTLPAGSDTISVSFAPTDMVGASTGSMDVGVNQGSDTNVTTDLAGGTMSVAAPSSLSFAVTLDGANQSINQPVSLTANDNTGTGDGWNLTVVSTPLKTSASTPVVIPSSWTVALNGSSSSANSTTPPAVADAGTGTYTQPSGNAAIYPLLVPGVHGASSTPAPVYTAVAGSGLGQFDLAADVWLSVPANAMAGNYAATFTWAIAVGP